MKKSLDLSEGGFKNNIKTSNSKNNKSKES
jgi:hypothetical protein